MRISFFLLILFLNSSRTWGQGEEKIHCFLDVKAVQAGNFWGGSYFDTAIRSGKLESLQYRGSVLQLEKKVERQGMLGIKDQEIMIVQKNNRNDLDDIFNAGFSLQLKENSNRQVSSGENLKIVEPKGFKLLTTIHYEQQTKKAEFEISKGQNSYIFMDVGKPNYFDFGITSLYLKCHIP